MFGNDYLGNDYLYICLVMIADEGISMKFYVEFEHVKMVRFTCEIFISCAELEHFASDMIWEISVCKRCSIGLNFKVLKNNFGICPTNL
jgi:hypothetical protein